MIGLIQQNIFLVIVIVALIIAIAAYVINKNEKESEETVVREFYGLGTIIRLRVDGKIEKKLFRKLWIDSIL